ncbi:tetratricopeptide repeat protein [Cytobacillus sp. IB215665]|uniref:tetratricopeptide repeat protein n=1 Tax=Cytobacillus sp. IB215665 TaxID=3097357 RepID=UPI002A0C6F20|nr:tetratricopeptide repeat protein [Cytobacillus sp. IB215665]MDX8363889.1 tetratricopeptide repeat protein [Cytobacillus sp. IB215665]
MGKNSKQSAIIIPFQDDEKLFLKGKKAYRNSDLYKAKKYLSRAIQLKPNEPEYLCQMAIVLMENGEFQQSNIILANILENVDPTMVECSYFMANNYAHLGLFQMSRKYALEYLKHAPDGEFSEDTEDLLELLSIEYDISTEAQDSEEDALILNQERARSLLEDGQFSEAIQLLNSMIKENPEFWSAYNNLALAHFYLGDLNRAIQILDEVFDKNPGNLHALCNMVIFFYYHKEDELVKPLINKLEKVYPITVEHRYKLGATFALVGESELAYKWLKQLYKQGFEGDGTYYYWLANAAYYSNHESFARNIWKKVIELSPERNGTEPWKMHVAHEVVKGANSLLKSDNKYERLYGLFLVSQGNNVEPTGIYQENVQTKYTSFESELAHYMTGKICQKGLNSHSGYIKNSYMILEQIFKSNKLSHVEMADLFNKACLVFDNGINMEYELLNTHAWAAAIEYKWKKLLRKKVTQREVALKYDVSVKTVSKYGEFVNVLLQ